VDTTVKLKKVTFDEDVEVTLHQITGTYDTEEDFDREWDLNETKEPEINNFMSMDIMHARRLVNNLIELIKE
jgi:hypothetical protein